MLKNKVAVVTGGADGIGRKIALELSGSETALMVRFLASSGGNYITGANYIIDGGRVLGA